MIAVETHGPGLYEFTDAVRTFVHRGGEQQGLLTLFVPHTSCSLLIQENADPDVKRDLQVFFSRLVPRADQPGMEWIRHREEGPDDMPAHIRTALLPTTLSIPVVEGQLALGPWQGIYLFEHRDMSNKRRVIAHLSR